METPRLWDCTWELAEVSADKELAEEPLQCAGSVSSALLEQLPPELCSRVPESHGMPAETPLSLDQQF